MKTLAAVLIRAALLGLALAGTVRADATAEVEITLDSAGDVANVLVRFHRDVSSPAQPELLWTSLFRFPCGGTGALPNIVERLSRSIPRVTGFVASTNARDLVVGVQFDGAASEMEMQVGIGGMVQEEYDGAGNQHFKLNVASPTDGFTRSLGTGREFRYAKVTETHVLLPAKRWCFDQARSPAWRSLGQQAADKDGASGESFAVYRLDPAAGADPGFVFEDVSPMFLWLREHALESLALFVAAIAISAVCARSLVKAGRARGNFLRWALVLSGVILVVTAVATARPSQDRVIETVVDGWRFLSVGLGLWVAAALPNRLYGMLLHLLRDAREVA